MNNGRQRQNNDAIFKVEFHNVGQSRNNVEIMTISKSNKENHFELNTLDFIFFFISLSIWRRICWIILVNLQKLKKVHKKIPHCKNFVWTASLCKISIDCCLQKKANSSTLRWTKFLLEGHCDYLCFRGALSGQKHFFATETPLKMMNSAFYSTSKTIFVLKFCLEILAMSKNGLIWKIRLKVHYCRFERPTTCSCSYKNNTLKIPHS